MSSNLKSKGPRNHAVNLYEDYPHDVPSFSRESLEKVPALAEWQRKMNQVWFELRTVLLRERENIERPLNEVIADLKEFSAATNKTLDEHKKLIDDLDKELDDLTLVVNTNTGDITSIKADITQIKLDITSIQNSLTNIEAGDITVTGPKPHLHTQLTASSAWTIKHESNWKYVQATVYSDSGDEEEGLVTVIDANTCQITFNQSITGHAVVVPGSAS